MKLVTLNACPTMEEALEAVDALRAAVVSGQVRGFYAVGISVDDTVFGYCGSSSPISRLRVCGALSQALYDWQSREI